MKKKNRKLLAGAAVGAGGLALLVWRRKPKPTSGSLPSPTYVPGPASFSLRDRSAPVTPGSPAVASAPKNPRAGKGFESLDDFLRGNTQYRAAGFSDRDVIQAAFRWSQSHGYYGPHAVHAEGHVEVRNGVPGVYIKYTDAGGSSTTEWTPLTRAPRSKPKRSKPKAHTESAPHSEPTTSARPSRGRTTFKPRPARPLRLRFAIHKKKPRPARPRKKVHIKKRVARRTFA